MSGKEVSPEFQKRGFNCPHCGAFAKQEWDQTTFGRVKTQIFLSKCTKCGDKCVWRDKKIYYPKSTTAPKPHDVMPDDLRRDYSEAAEVVDSSPRAAAALLRLGIQRLLEDHLDTPGDGIYQDIGHLVEENEIHPRTQKMLDSVRITGNNSVHPGEMDMDDNHEVALALFKLFNYVVDETIGRDKEIEEFYNTLPENHKQGVENRDKN
ncbi:DUF4145 domain-containing protein [Haloferax sp. DFSO60]|uniref:DUF4145 domain-containing protein n=1 Tax=Haloferax sp. DFSO60 TaxID=3388652 RepID=UPI0039798E2C